MLPTARHIAVIGGLLLALAAFVVEDRLNGSRTQAQDSSGAEVRLAARDDRSGSTLVGLQYRVSGKWQFLAPARNVLPATAALDRWYTSSGVEIDVAQARAEIGVRNRVWSTTSGPDQFTITIGGKRYVARCGLLMLSLVSDGLEVQTGTRDCQDIVTVDPPELAEPTSVGPQVLRIAARRLLNGGIEMGLQRLVDGHWEAMSQPTRRVLSRLSGTVWRFTPEIQLSRLSGHVSGELRRGVSLTTRDGEFDLEVDGRVYRSRCGVLELDILAEHILVDTRDDQCQRSVPLLTICPTSNCDVQQNAAYAWESRQSGETLDSIELTLSQARAVVNALFDDYFPPFSPPRVSFSYDQEHGHGSRDEIVLGTRTQTLGAAVHELAHALVDRSNARDAGHGGAFLAMLLDVWERYFPIVDVGAARDDARRSGLEVASAPPARAVRNRAGFALVQTLCSEVTPVSALCVANSGTMSGASEQTLAGEYTGWGSQGDSLSWFAWADDDVGVPGSHLLLRSYEQVQEEPVATLIVTCRNGEGLDVNVRWRAAATLSPSVAWRVGSQAWSEEAWETLADRSGGGGWHIHLDPEVFVRDLAWRAIDGGDLVVTFRDGSELQTARFDLEGLLDAPVIPSLVRCDGGVGSDADSPIIDHGRFGADFFWGVDEDDDPLQTYVVRDTTISGSSREARLSVQCEDDVLEVDIYWDVDEDLDWTVLYRINSDGEVQSEEWSSGWGRWGDTEYKWTGRENAGDLVSELAWAAQADSVLTVTVHERRNPNNRVTATWDLDGLFDTPVQPNLARCGR